MSCTAITTQIWCQVWGHLNQAKQNYTTILSSLRPTDEPRSTGQQELANGLAVRIVQFKDAVFPASKAVRVNRSAVRTGQFKDAVFPASRAAQETKFTEQRNLASRAYTGAQFFTFRSRDEQSVSYFYYLILSNL